jgi:hypothetical protein
VNNRIIENFLNDVSYAVRLLAECVSCYYHFLTIQNFVTTTAMTVCYWCGVFPLNGGASSYTYNLFAVNGGSFLLNILEMLLLSNLCIRHAKHIFIACLWPCVYLVYLIIRYEATQGRWLFPYLILNYDSPANPFLVFFTHVGCVIGFAAMYCFLLGVGFIKHKLRSRRSVYESY